MEQQQTIRSEAYRNFINSINSEVTRKDYEINFSYFMTFCKITDYEEMKLFSPIILEGLIRDYIIYLRHERNLSPATVSSYLAPITHFYEMNDITVKWKKLKKFKAKHRSVVEDKPYTREQIKKLVDAAPIRDKCIILVMASAGLRRGAIPYLRIRDIQKIDEYQLYKISVYRKEEEQYVTFCTPECAKHIDQYLGLRARLGEKLQPNSPLFRIAFDPITEINRPKTPSTCAISKMVNKLLGSTGVRAAAETRQPTELMQTHGFRKFFKTTCINAGMNPLYSEYVMGHKSGLTTPSDMELLEGNDKALGYLSVINDLTINEEYILRMKIDSLTEKKDEIEAMEIRHNQEIKSMRDQMNKIISMIQHNPKLAHIKPESLIKKRVS